MMVARVVLDMDHEQGENAGRAFQITLRNFALASFQSEGVSLTEVEKQDVATMVARLNKLAGDFGSRKPSRHRWSQPSLKSRIWVSRYLSSSWSIQVPRELHSILRMYLSLGLTS